MSSILCVYLWKPRLPFLAPITVNYSHLWSITLADYNQLQSFTVNYGRRLQSAMVIYSQLRSPITVHYGHLWSITVADYGRGYTLIDGNRPESLVLLGS